MTQMEKEASRKVTLHCKISASEQCRPRNPKVVLSKTWCEEGPSTWPELHVFVQVRLKRPLLVLEAASNESVKYLS